MMWSKLFFVFAALFMPIIWGVVVHRLFEFAEVRLKSGKRPHDGTYSDYQI